MRFAHRDQRGITLIEMLVVVALMGIIAAGIAMTISQVMAVNSRTSSHMVALRQVQQAGDRISKDALQSKPPPVVGSDPGSFLTLTIPQSGVDTETKEVYEFEHVIVYTLEEMPGGLWRLYRTRSEYDRDGELQGAVTTIVAQYLNRSIDPVTNKPRTNWEWDPTGRVLSITLSAQVGQRIETRVYEVEPRPGS